MYNRIRKKIDTFFFKIRGVSMKKGASIHRSVDIHNHKNLTIGSDSILYKNNSIYIGVKGGMKMGNNSHIAPFGYLLIDKNRIEIGNDVAIGPFCSFICHSNDLEGEHKEFSKNYLDSDITIGNNVFIGAQCVILPGVVIEDNVVVASNSVVKGRLSAGSVYGGSPVKLIKSL
ncbi:MAG: DapH/DapD/GlmU-related protein [Crocinitomicaceae bacterium]